MKKPFLGRTEQQWQWLICIWIGGILFATAILLTLSPEMGKRMDKVIEQSYLREIPMRIVSLLLRLWNAVVALWSQESISLWPQMHAFTKSLPREPPREPPRPTSHAVRRPLSPQAQRQQMLQAQPYKVLLHSLWVRLGKVGTGTSMIIKHMDGHVDELYVIEIKHRVYQTFWTQSEIFKTYWSPYLIELARMNTIAVKDIHGEFQLRFYLDGSRFYDYDTR